MSIVEERILIESTLSTEHYDFLSRSVKEVSGLHLGDTKHYLVETRLQPLLKQLGFSSIDRFIEALRGPQALKLRMEFAEAMATSETFFFRDKKPFDEFSNFIVPTFIKTKNENRSLRVWSAACSSGQEPYSLAILFEELQKTILKGWTLSLLATDFSSKILKKAQMGIYTQFEVQRGLPAQYLIRHFIQNGNHFVVKDEIKKYITFKHHNLLHGATSLGKFDVVFCRNVLFYLEQNAKIRILEELVKTLNPGGFLFLGSAETLVGLTKNLVPHPEHKGLYVLAGDL